jgi:F420 biosynthesis protein FbiB-like protein
MNDLHNFLRTRRSIRQFEQRPIPQETLQRILETSTYAPSARNRQPWQLVVITTPTAKVSLAETMVADFRPDLEKDGLPALEIEARLEHTRRRILDAPAVVLLCLNDDHVDAQRNKKRQQAEQAMACQSVSLCGLQLMLAAHAEGIGSVWTCGPLFAADTIRTTLELPAEWTPLAMILLGYPAETPDEKSLRLLDEVVKFI